jgi:hypothetical protein
MVEIDLDSGREAGLVVGPDRPAQEIGFEAAPRALDVGACPDQDLPADHAHVQRFDHL